MLTNAQKKGEKEATPLTVAPPDPAPPNNLWWELDAFVKLVQVCTHPPSFAVDLNVVIDATTYNDCDERSID